MKVQLFVVHDIEHTGFDNGDNIEAGRIISFLKERSIQSDVTYISRKKGVQFNIDDEETIYLFIAYNTSIDYIFDNAKYIKDNGNKNLVFLFSRFATEAADLILDECLAVDGIILGHAEFPLFDLVKELEAKKNVDDILKDAIYIKSQKYRIGKERCNTDINLLPLPDRSHLTKNNGGISYICASHGCVCNCSFCGLFYKERKWSGRNAQSIFDEIIGIYEKASIRNFVFTDASFEDPGEMGKKRIFELCELLLNYPIRFAFRCFLRAETFKDNEQDINLLKLMKAAGFTTIIIGIEAGNEYDLRLYNKRATLEDNNCAFEVYAKAGIEILYGFIMLNPYSNKERLKDNFNYLKKIACYHLEFYVSAVRVWYDTPLYNKLKEDNLLIDEKDYKNYYGYKFKDMYTAEVFKLIEEKFDFNNEIMKLDFEFYNFIHFYNYIKTIVPANLDNIIEEVEVVKNELAHVFCEYFKIMYIEGNIEKAYMEFDSFKEQLVMIYKRTRKIKSKFIKLYVLQQ